MITQFPFQQKNLLQGVDSDSIIASKQKLTEALSKFDCNVCESPLEFYIPEGHKNISRGAYHCDFTIRCTDNNKIVTKTTQLKKIMDHIHLNTRKKCEKSEKFS